MKKSLRTWGLALLSVMMMIAAVPRTACATSATAAAQPQDEYQKQLEDTYKQEVQTNQLKDWPQGPGIYGDAGIVMDAQTGAILYGKNIDAAEYPASITKILTALLALKYCDMTDEVTISAECLSCLGDGYASIGMKEGNVITMEQALYAMLLASSNEVACAVGETVAKKQGKDYQWFIEEMNRTVRELGGTNSNFVNTNGVHNEQHYTCARDMALIAKELFNYPEFLTICQTATYTIPASDTTEEHVFWQKHEMLLPGSKDSYEYAVGGKTGYTTEANNTLVTMADNGSMKLVCVTLKIFPGHVYSDTRALLDYGFQNFQHVSVEKEEHANIKKMPENAQVTLPTGMDTKKLDSKLGSSTGANNLELLSYTYEDNPVGEMQVEVKKDASFKEADAGEEETGEKGGILKTVMILAAVLLAAFVLACLYASHCRRKRRKRRRRRRRR